jgi:hypothetical protein
MLMGRLSKFASKAAPDREGFTRDNLALRAAQCHYRILQDCPQPRFAVLELIPSARNDEDIGKFLTPFFIEHIGIITSDDRPLNEIPYLQTLLKAHYAPGCMIRGLYHPSPNKELIQAHDAKIVITQEPKLLCDPDAMVFSYLL